MTNALQEPEPRLVAPQTLAVANAPDAGENLLGRILFDMPPDPREGRLQAIERGRQISRGVAETLGERPGDLLVLAGGRHCACHVGRMPEKLHFDRLGIIGEQMRALNGVVYGGEAGA